MCEFRMGPAHVVGRATYRTLEQVADAFLQDAVRRKPDRVLDAFRFQILVDIGIGEARVGAEIDARDLAAIARHDGLQHILPAVGAVNVAGTKRAAFQIAELIEHEQRMIAGAVVVAVLLFSCSPCVGLTLESMSSKMPFGGRRPWTISIHWPDKSARAERFADAAS